MGRRLRFDSELFLLISSLILLVGLFVLAHWFDIRRG